MNDVMLLALVIMISRVSSSNCLAARLLHAQCDVIMAHMGLCRMVSGEICWPQYTCNAHRPLECHKFVAITTAHSLFPDLCPLQAHDVCAWDAAVLIMNFDEQLTWHLTQRPS